MKRRHLSFEKFHHYSMGLFFLFGFGNNESDQIFAWYSTICIFLLLIILFLSSTLYLERKKKPDNPPEKDKAIKARANNEMFQKKINKQFEEINADSLNTSFSHRWDWLKKEIDRLHNHFTVRLKVCFPNLSEDEIRLCCLIRIETDTHGITKYLNISKEYLRTKKSRLAKKFKIRNCKKQLEHFIRDF